MKRFLKILGVIIAVVVVLLVLGAATIHFRGIPTYEVNAPELEVEMDSVSIANGERLVNMVCAECHRGEKTTALVGKKLLDIPTFFGTVYSSNITQDPEHGIGKYTQGEIAFALRAGIKKDGRYLPPYMPKFANMADEDLHDVIAYLKSDSPPVQADPTQTPPCEPSFMTKMLSNFAFLPLPYPEKEVPKPDPSDKVALGKYIVQGMVNCYDCHSADFKTNDPLIPENSEGFLGGGNKLLDLDGNIIYAPNITMDQESGLGNWTEEQFIQAVKFGQHPEGKPIRYPMLKLTQLTDYEVGAIWEYLKTVPKIKNEY